MFYLGVVEWDENASEIDTSDVFGLTTLRTSRLIAVPVNSLSKATKLNLKKSKILLASTRNGVKCVRRAFGRDLLF